MDAVLAFLHLSTLTYLYRLLITLGVILIGAVVLNTVLQKFLRTLTSKLADRNLPWPSIVTWGISKPLSILVLLYAVYSMLLALPVELIGKSVLANVSTVVDVLVAAVICWASFRIIERAKIVFKDHGTADMTTVLAISRLLQTLIIIFFALNIMQKVGFNIQSILAVGGIGGVALGFASKDLLANFFGGLMIYLDRPFSEGDWIRSPDRQIEGTVERIGWRLTMIRTFDKRPLYVPNSVFANISVENPSRMLNRRIYETIGVRYDDGRVVKAIVDDVRQMLQQHNDIEQNATMIVNLVSFGASSLNFFIYTFTKTTNWIEFHHIKEDVMLKIMDIIEQHGAEIAFPTTTVLFGEGGEPLTNEVVSIEPDGSASSN
ncbi:Low conductance mechanosensitive channel YnaI [BD1-7 clade bacterium]|uniref:Low conductance mechanosensitive channel YnaI n=1 Tax=BD1-7 clade bacterium TaxID=2029982 RepID=A0A5S9P156_9GAMM|nr:Low conductance mechanosensitive channel YnaI [BD1-7 clade bacterium]